MKRSQPNLAILTNGLTILNGPSSQIVINTKTLAEAVLGITSQTWGDSIRTAEVLASPSSNFLPSVLGSLASAFADAVRENTNAVDKSRVLAVRVHPSNTTAVNANQAPVSIDASTAISLSKPTANYQVSSVLTGLFGISLPIVQDAGPSESALVLAVQAPPAATVTDEDFAPAPSDPPQAPPAPEDDDYNFGNVEDECLPIPYSSASETPSSQETSEEGSFVSGECYEQGCGYA